MLWRKIKQWKGTGIAPGGIVWKLCCAVKKSLHRIDFLIQ